MNHRKVEQEWLKEITARASVAEARFQAMEEVEANCAICCQYSRVQTCEKCEREVCSSDDCFDSMSGLCTYCKKAKERNLPMEQETMLLACKHISEPARKELKRAGCTIHKDVPGIDDLEIVELRYEGDGSQYDVCLGRATGDTDLFEKSASLLWLRGGGV